MIELLNKTVGQCLKETAQKFPQRLCFEHREWSCTFSEADRITDLFAGRLRRSYGIQKGMHIGIWCVNTPSFAFTYLALQKIGAVCVVFNTYYKVEEMVNTLQASDTEILFYGAGCKDTVFDDLVPEIKKRASKVRHFYRIDPQEAGVWMSEDSFRDDEKTKEVMEEIYRTEALVEPEDPSVIIFTSGTTSEAKGAVLTHYNVVNDVYHVKHYMHWTEEDKMCCPASWFHCFGLITGLTGCVVNGFAIHILPNFKTKRVWEAILDYHCTIMVGVPSMYLALIRKPEYEGRKGESLKSGIVGGSPLPPEDYLEICGRFPNMQLQTSFGMTEASASVSFTSFDEPVKKKAVTTGHVMEGIECRIMDIEKGVEQPTGQEGEIQLRGFNIMKGYYRNPEKTREAFTEDGWFRTGDLGYLNEDRELCISGRLKEMIIRAGENISPKEIEEVVYRSGMVESAKVIAIPSKFRQEEVALCITEKKSGAADIQSLYDFMGKRLADYKLPKYIVSFDDFPLNASGKIDSKKLRDKVLELSEKRDERCHEF